jgi:hypothetical protein
LATGATDVLAADEDDEDAPPLKGALAPLDDDEPLPPQAANQDAPAAAPVKANKRRRVARERGRCVMMSSGMEVLVRDAAQGDGLGNR